MVDKTTSIGDKYGQKGFTQKKVTSNTKYSGVTSSLNTGKTAKMVVSQSKYAPSDSIQVMARRPN